MTLGTTELPLTRVKRIMKEDEDLKVAGTEVTLLVALAAVIYYAASFCLRIIFYHFSIYFLH